MGKRLMWTAAEKVADVPIEEIESSVQGYYDDPNALNFHMQVLQGIIIVVLLMLILPCSCPSFGEQGRLDRPLLPVYLPA